MSGLLVHKGYHGTIEPDIEEGDLRGEALFISDTLTYRGRTIKEITAAFRSTVDGYLELCAERGISPKKPLRGSITIRIGEELHRLAALEAVRTGETLNQLITKALAARLNTHIELRPRGRQPGAKPSAKAGRNSGKGRAAAVRE